MRRVMLLALLIVALPTAVFAGSISFANSSAFNYDTGNFLDFKLGGNIVTGATATFTVVGSLNTISLTTGPLTVIPGGTSRCDEIACFSWGNGGKVTVSHDGSVLFRNSLSGGGGVIDDFFSVSAGLLPNSTVLGGSADIFIDFSDEQNTSASVNGTSSVPEPSALELLELGLVGVGVIGLGRMARQSKLQT